MVEPIVCDNSLLRTLACSTKALMRHRFGYTSREESAALRAGTAIHAALAAFFDPKGTGDPTLAMATLSESYERWAKENVSPDDRLGWPNVSRIMEAWFAQHPVGSFPFTVKHVEIGFSFPIADDVSLCGRMDGIVEMHADRSLYTLEWKSTGQLTPWWLAKFRLDSQITLYTDGAQQHLDGQRVQGVVLGAIDLKKAPGGPDAKVVKCREHGVPYAECGALQAPAGHMRHEMTLVQRTPESLVEGRKTALHLARRWRELNEKYPNIEDIHRVRMQGTFIDGFCGMCEFKDFCASGRPLDLIDSMMVKDPWQPFQHAMTGQTSSKEPTNAH